MPTQSPSGSACPYYYMGGELHPLKYGSFFSDKARLFKVIRAEEEFILRSPGTANRRIWIDLYETQLDGEAARALARHLQAIERKIRKLCFVGCSFFGAFQLRRAMAALHLDAAKQARFFSDPEEAKKWLVGEANGTG
jgi:hypothetical protein